MFSGAQVLRCKLKVPFNVLHIVLVAALLEGTIRNRWRIEAKASSARGHARNVHLFLPVSKLLQPVLGQIGDHLLEVQTKRVLQIDLELSQLLLELRVEDFFIAHILHSHRHEV